jgi:hypothetical protein
METKRQPTHNTKTRAPRPDFTGLAGDKFSPKLMTKANHSTRNFKGANV